jgi:hypothetical protein
MNEHKQAEEVPLCSVRSSTAAISTLRQIAGASPKVRERDPGETALRECPARRPAIPLRKSSLHADRRDEDNMTRLEIVFLLLFITIAVPHLHAERLHSQNLPKKDKDLGECVVKTPGNTVTIEITIRFETNQPTDSLNVIIVFADLHGIILPLANVHATYIAEERYNLTARVGQQAMIGEYRLSDLRVASPIGYTKPFHADYKDGKRNCIAVEQGIQQPASSIPRGEIIHIGPPQ